MRRTKETATSELQNLAEATHSLAEAGRHSEDHVRWLTKARRFLRDVFGEDSDYFVSFTSLTWKREGSFLVGGPARPQETWDPQRGFDRVHHEAYVQQLAIARGLLLGAADELAESDIAEVYKGKDTGPEASLLLKIINIVSRGRTWNASFRPQ